MVQEYELLENTSTFRKVASIMWNPANDPQIYGFMDIDATKIISYIEEYSRKNGVKITITHVIAKVVALLLKKFPELNAKVKNNKIYLRKHINIYLQVAASSGRDLSGVLLDDADKLTLKEMALAISEKSKKIREDKDPVYQKARDKFRNYGYFRLKLILKLMSKLTNDWNIDLSKKGAPQDPFGSAMVTSVGMFGIDTGFAPLPPIARCPLIILIPEIKERPWVENGQLCVRPVLRLCATFDHRIIDGYQAGALANELKELLMKPEKIE